ncbi:MAG: PAS domain S-box protein [Desulfobacterales bacterium]|nr:PAS domain S-box protein [Desulfobacterales bacterium]
MKFSQSSTIVISYVLLGALWILTSDSLVDYFWTEGFSSSSLQTIKGLAFILVSAVFLYVLLQNNFRKMLSAELRLRKSEARYRAAFENSPGPIWVEDFSEVKAALEEMHRSGVQDVMAHLETHPDFIHHCIQKVRILDMNQAAVDLHGAKNKAELMQSLSVIFSDESLPGLKDEILAIAEGKTDFQVQVSGRTVDGRPIDFIVRWSVLPGHEKSLDRVYVSATDVTEMNRVRNELAESEHRYRALVENANEAVLVVQNQRIRFANPAAEKIYGRSFDQMHETSIGDMIHPEDRDKVLERHQRRIAGENPVSRYPLRMLCAEGKTRWMNISAARIQWNGKPSVVLIGSDITAVKKEQEELQKTKNLLEKVFNSLDEAVFLIDPEGRRIVACNPTVEAIFGYTPEDLIGRSSRLLHVDQAHYDRFGEESQAVLSENGKFHTKFRMRCKNGREIITEHTISVVDEMLGWSKGVISVVKDITEKEAAERALRDSEEKYRRLLQHANESVVVVQNGRIVFANSQMMKMSGYSHDEMLGDLYLGYVDSEDVAYTESLITHLLKGRGIPKDVEFRMIDSEGNRRWIRANAVALEWHDQPAVMGLMTDITEQKRLLQKNKEMEAQIMQAQKMESIGVLAGGIAHDFNNLLSVILGFSRIVIDELPEKNKGRKDLKTVVAAAERASELVSQILTFSRRDEEDKQPLQVHLVLKEALKMLRSSIPAQIDIRQDIRTESAVEIAPGRMHQVIMNIFTNAYQAMPPNGGKIRVVLDEADFGPSEAARLPGLTPGRHVVLSISDNGSGIPPEVVDRIFDPYFTTKDVGRGTGLGLSMVHGIVKRAGGEVTVKSELGKGTRVKVFLPLWQGEPGKLPSQEKKKTENGGSERLLVVDDERAVLRLLKISLESMGYRVSAHSRAREALAAIRNESSIFDAVITDLAMPEMTGKELAMAVKDIRPDLPVILCTGTQDVTAEQKSGEGNIRAIISKPFDKESMGKIVRGALDAQKPASNAKHTGR